MSQKIKNFFLKIKYSICDLIFSHNTIIEDQCASYWNEFQRVETCVCKICKEIFWTRFYSKPNYKFTEKISNPSGLKIIEALVPKLSRFAFETKTDYFTELNSQKYLDSVIYQMINRRTSIDYSPP